MRYLISTSPLVGDVVAVLDDREEAIGRARRMYLREERFGTLLLAVGANTPTERAPERVDFLDGLTSEDIERVRS